MGNTSTPKQHQKLLQVIEKKWAERLEAMTTVNTIVLPHSATIESTLPLVSGIEQYSYSINVRTQNSGDDIGELRSRVRILLLDAPPQPILDALKKYGLTSGRLDANASQVEEFKRTLTLPKLEHMERYVQALREGFTNHLRDEAKLSGHAFDESIPNIVDEIIEFCKSAGEDAGDLASPEKFIQSILLDNLKPYYPEVIANGFQKFLATYKLPNDKETPETLVQTYFEKDPMACTRYLDLRFSDIRAASALKINLIRFAENSLNAKLIEFYHRITMEALDRHLIMVLKKLPAENPSDDKAITEAIIKAFKKEPAMATAFSYLEIHDAVKLQQNVITFYKYIANRYQNATRAYLKKQLADSSLVTLPKPATMTPYSMLATEFFNLLPTADKKDVSKWVVYKNDLDVQTEAEVKDRERNLNLLAVLVANEIDNTGETLTKLYNDNLNRVLWTHIQTSLTHPDLLRFLNSKSPEFLSELLSNDEVAQRTFAAPPLNLYAPLIGFEPQRGFYTLGIRTITQNIQNKVREILTEKLQFIFQLILRSYHLIDRDKLQYIFTNLLTPDAKVSALQQTIHDLIRLPEGKAIADEKMQVVTRTPPHSLTASEHETLGSLVEESQTNTLRMFVNFFSPSFVQGLRTISQTADHLSKHLQNHIILINNVIQDLHPFNSEFLLKRLLDTRLKLESLKERIQELAFLPYAQIEAERISLLTEIKQCFDSLVNLLSDELNSNLGGISPDKSTSTVRLYLCQMLGIKQPPRYIDSHTALAWDQTISVKCQDLYGIVLPAELKTVQPPYRMAPEPAFNLIGAPLTPHSLAQLAANWLATYGNLPPGQSLPSPALANLFNALNNVPPSCRGDEPLPPAWCEKFIKNWLYHPAILHEMQPKNKAEPFLFALKNCSNFVSTRAQEGKTEDKVWLTHFTDILAIYYNQPSTRLKFIGEEGKGEAKEAVRQEGMKLMVDAQYQVGPIPISAFRRGPKKSFFKQASSGMDKLAMYLEAIKRRHGGMPDFELNRGDIQLLQKALQDRWENSSKNPDEYIAFVRATDKNYLLIALMLKKALANFGIETTAHELLMPNHIRKGQFHLDEKTVGYDLFYDIDEFNWKDSVIFLPNQDWFPKAELIRFYQDSGRLINPCTQTELTPGDIKYILVHYPELENRLCAICLDKNGINPIASDPTIKTAFIKFINSTVLRYSPEGHSATQDVIATKGWIELMAFITALPDWQKRYLMNVQMVGSRETLEQYIARNQNKNRQDNECITYFGKEFALLVLQHYPDTAPTEFGKNALHYWGHIFTEESAKLKKITKQLCSKKSNVSSRNGFIRKNVKPFSGCYVAES